VLVLGISEVGREVLCLICYSIHMNATFFFFQSKLKGEEVYFESFPLKLDYFFFTYTEV